MFEAQWLFVSVRPRFKLSYLYRMIGDEDMSATVQWLSVRVLQGPRQVNSMLQPKWVRLTTRDWPRKGYVVTLLSAQVNRPSNVTVIAIMCEEFGQTWWPHWGPWTVGNGVWSALCCFVSIVLTVGCCWLGLGGSEEAVVHTVRSLHKQFGHRIHIEVYADPVEDNIGFRDGAAWYPGALLHLYSRCARCKHVLKFFAILERSASWYDGKSHPADVFIAWRYPISVSLAMKSRAIYVWLHDVSSMANSCLMRNT
jgi:hypothetical protein